MTTLAIVGLVAAYIKYAPLYPRHAYLSGWVLFAAMLFLTFFNLRKRIPFLRIGSASFWLQLHLYVGVFSGALFFVHIGWSWPAGIFHQLLAWCYVIAFLTESQRTYRIVYMDGRGHPPDAQDYPEWMGSSIGRWEGDTLVVETIGIHERSWLDTSGHEHSDKLKMIERFRLSARNVLEHVVTYEDPVFFVKPFTTRREFKRQVGDQIMDHACLENEKDIKNLVPTLGDAGR